MRNAVKRVTHKERAQPKARAKFGLLEKHKDYVERATDFKKKRTAIKTLKKKAAERNPDEFYFAMNTSSVEIGVHQSLAGRGKSIDTATVRLLKTQDMGYIVHKKSIDDQKAAKLGQNLHFIGEAAPRKHKIFVDDQNSMDTFNVATHFDTAPELVDRAFNRPRSGKIDQIIVNGDTSSKTKASTDNMKRVLKKTTKAYKELHARTKRSEKLKKVMNGLALQRNLMGKGSKKKIIIKGNGGTSNDDGDDEDRNAGRKRRRNDDDDHDSNNSKSTVVYKWKRERRR